MDYANNREKFINKRRGKDFKDAVVEMDEFISDPVVSYYQLNKYRPNI